MSLAQTDDFKAEVPGCEQGTEPFGKWSWAAGANGDSKLPGDQQHLTARYKTWFVNHLGFVGGERGGGASGTREKLWKDLNFSQQQVSGLREKCIGKGSWAGSLAGLRGWSHFGSVVVEMVKGLLRIAGLGTQFCEEDKAAWGRRAVLSQRAKPRLLFYQETEAEMMG